VLQLETAPSTKYLLRPEDEAILSALEQQRDQLMFLVEEMETASADESHASLQPKSKSEDPKQPPKSKSEEQKHPPESKSEDPKQPPKSKSEEQKHPPESKSEDPKQPPKSKSEDQKQPPKSKSEEQKHPQESKSEDPKQPPKSKSEEQKQPPKSKSDTKDQSIKNTKEQKHPPESKSDTKDGHKTQQQNKKATATIPKLSPLSIPELKKLDQALKKEIGTDQHLVDSLPKVDSSLSHKELQKTNEELKAALTKAKIGLKVGAATAQGTVAKDKKAQGKGKQEGAKKHAEKA